MKSMKSKKNSLLKRTKQPLTTKKSTRKRDSQSQSQRQAFIAKAKELGFDENPEAFMKVLSKIAPPKRIKRA